MLVREVMSKEPHYLSPEDNLQTIAHEMHEHDFGFMPIGENDRLIGVVTDRDIALRAVAEGKNPKDCHARECLSPKVFYCYEDWDIKAAAKSMEDLQIHRLIVLNNDKDKRMTGIISLGDMGKHCHNTKLCGRVVEEISEDR